MENPGVIKKMHKEIEIEIPFYDLDPMQVVWHGNYIKYMEKGRCALLSDMHMTYADMADAGFAFPVVKLNVKYIRPCTFGMHIIVKTTLVPSENFLIFKYEISDALTGTKLCCAETKQMAVNLQDKSGLPIIPEPFISKIMANK